MMKRTAAHQTLETLFAGAILLLLSTSCMIGTPAHAQLRPPQVPALVALKDTNYPVPSTGAFYVAPETQPAGSTVPLGKSTNSGVTAAFPWTVAKALDNAPAGATLVFRGGDYRGVSSEAISKKFTLQAFAHEKPWLKGSVVVTGWAQEGSLWVKTGWTYGFPVNAGPENIDPDFPLSSARDMVFVDNLALVQVGNKDAVVPGTFFVDYEADKLYLRDDPRNKTVEATAFATAFDLTSDVPQLVIRGLGFAHFADNGLQTNKNHRSRIEDCTFAWNGNAGLWLFLADDVTLRGNTLSCNGQNGLFGFYSDRALIENNVFSHNNVEQYNLAWGGCALKLGYNKDTVFRNNLVEHNNGTGIWLDTSNLRCTVINNVARHNAAFGIFMELNHDCIVAFNVCHDNSRGIALSDSSAIRVYNNTLSRNGRALSVFDSHRVNDPNDGQEFYGETAAAFNEGITWVSRDNVFKNNIYSNSRSAGGLLLDALDADTGASSSRQIAASDFNAYFRTSSGTPSKVIRWRGGTWWNPVDYATLADFRKAHAAYEAHGLAIDNVSVHPFFVNENATPEPDLRLKPGSIALGRGEALPADIAQAVGKPAGVPVHLGALPVATSPPTPIPTPTPAPIPVPTPANKAPTVSLTSPANGAPFTAPATITLNATASDTDGTISKVEFFRNNVKLGEDTTSPYTYPWNNVAAGTYTLSAKAFDNDGASATTPTITITVNAAPPANKPPSVTLTGPANGATFATPASITLSATASDTDGAVAKVEFYQGSVKIGEDTTAPYTTTWAGVAAGTYTLSAKATDNDGDSTTSAAVTVTVNAAAPTPLPAPVLVNLALNKNATQSSTPAGTTSGANTAALAVDDDTDGNWAHGSVTHTGLDKQAWWQLDLGASRAIRTIEVFNRTDGASARLSHFFVLVSDTPFVSTDLTTTLAQPGVWHFTSQAVAGSLTPISVYRHGRYVRVQLAGTNYLSLAEVKVMGFADALPNLALNKMATQSSRPVGTPAPSAAIDGNTDGRWSGGSITHTHFDNQPWWQVDLGQIQSISTINLFNRSDNSQGRLGNVHVFVSEVPFTSTDLTTTLKQPGVWHGYLSGTVGTPTSVPVHRSGRYLRVQLGDMNYLSLAEVQVLGFPGPDPNANLSLNKIATQSSRPVGTPAAGAAVDGNTDGNWGGGSITHTGLDNQPWWQLDLGASNAITRVELFNRSDNSQQRLGNVYVLVSDVPFVSGNLQATLAQPGVWATHLAVQAGSPTSVAVHRTGRFVRVQLAGTNYLSLAEVKVLGLPIIGQAAAATTATAASPASQAPSSLEDAPSRQATSPAATAPGTQSAREPATRRLSPDILATPSALSVARPTAGSGEGTGLLGEYFDNPDGTDLKTVRLDKTIDFNWGRSIPAGTAITHPDTWSVRWTGFIEAPVSGVYTFTTTSDDGIRLWVNGKLLVDDKNLRKATEHHNTILLHARRRYRVTIEYFEGYLSAQAKLWWTYPGQTKQIIPTRWLYPTR